MRCHGIGPIILCLVLPAIGLAQASNGARAEILRRLIAEEAAARIDLPFGGEGVQLSDRGEINKDKLQKQIQKNGKSVQSGRVVALTSIEFNDKNIDIELDGGGNSKKGLFGGHVQVSVGVESTPPSSAPSSAPRAKGSKITLTFASKVPADLTPDQIKLLLSPVLDFTKRTSVSTTLESLPPEFQEAVLAREARIGMDQETVLLAMGRPNLKTAEKVNGVEQEEWQYRGRGDRRTFVTFENSIVVKITEY